MREARRGATNNIKIFLFYFHPSPQIFWVEEVESILTLECTGLLSFRSASFQAHILVEADGERYLYWHAAKSISLTTPRHEGGIHPKCAAGYPSYIVDSSETTGSTRSCEETLNVASSWHTLFLTPFRTIFDASSNAESPTIFVLNDSRRRRTSGIMAPPSSRQGH